MAPEMSHIIKAFSKREEGQEKEMRERGEKEAAGEERSERRGIQSIPMTPSLHSNGHTYAIPISDTYTSVNHLPLLLHSSLFNILSAAKVR